MGQDSGNTCSPSAEIQAFPAAGPLEFIAMDILGPIPRSIHGNRFILVITDRFSKLIHAVPLMAASATDVAMAFLIHWIYQYGLLLYLLTENGSQFLSKFFEYVCSALALKHLLTASTHPHTNGRAERFNHTLATRMAYYFSEHQLDRDDFVHPLVYDYNTQVHNSTGTTPFDLALIWIPSAYMVEIQDTPQPQDVTAEMK